LSIPLRVDFHRTDFVAAVKSRDVVYEVVV
jgi:hypothetical protein